MDRHKSTHLSSHTSLCLMRPSSSLLPLPVMMKKMMIMIIIIAIFQASRYLLNHSHPLTHSFNHPSTHPFTHLLSPYFYPPTHPTPSLVLHSHFYKNQLSFLCPQRSLNSLSVKAVKGCMGGVVGGGVYRWCGGWRGVWVV